jgi:hypothetical protein
VMSDPLAVDDTFWGAIDARLAQAFGPVLLLERWARGGGRRSWFLLLTASDLQVARKVVRPGSSVTAYLHPDLPVQGKWSEGLACATKALLEKLGPNEELVMLVDRGSQPLLEAEYIANLEDLKSSTSAAGEAVWIGRYPAWLPDGEMAITRVVPDADGVVRSHPY